MNYGFSWAITRPIAMFFFPDLHLEFGIEYEVDLLLSNLHSQLGVFPKVF